MRRLMILILIMVRGFGNLEPTYMEEFGYMIILAINVDKDNGFHDGLDINLGSIKMNILAYKKKTFLKHIWNKRRKYS
jgi:hypothetical protein